MPVIVKPRCPCMTGCDVRTKECRLTCEKYLQYEKATLTFYEDRDLELREPPKPGFGLDGYPLQKVRKYVADDR